MIGEARINYSNCTPLLTFGFTGDSTEVITKVSVYSQKSWGKENATAHWSREYNPAVSNITYGSIELTSEELDGDWSSDVCSSDLETQVRSLGREDPLEKEMATHSSILAWRIPGMVEPGGRLSMGSHRVGHD